MVLLATVLSLVLLFLNNIWLYLLLLGYFIINNVICVAVIRILLLLLLLLFKYPNIHTINFK